MGRAGYSDDWDFDNWSHIRWRGQVASATKGKRGQSFLLEMITALDAMPERRLVTNELQDGPNVCAIGSVGLCRGVDMAALDPEDPWAIAAAFDIASPLVREIEYENDEYWQPETPEQRWKRMRAWAVRHLTPVSLAALAASPLLTAPEDRA